jgi:alkanesulfonate monooxygenase SsuD/methylene tetrahydromethanopterin reductase-like flavin-dependent oxidoreductase (luciferase family)
MKFGFILPFGDARVAADTAYEAEAAGWDGFFVWDAPWGIDPWVSLAAAAMRTQRVRLGTMLTPVSRRRPWKLASETATLDNLSGGRVILAVGLGAIDTGFAELGEETERKKRAELMDEGLAIVEGLWHGQPFSFDGQHYHVREIKFRLPPPPPVQQPRIPVWVVGAWPRERSMQRVLHWDGLLPNKLNSRGKHQHVRPNDLRRMKAWIEERLDPPRPFDYVMEGDTPIGDPQKAAEMVRPWQEAGATWWLESMWEENDPANVLKRIRQGPPVL